MKYCKTCGKEINDEATICPHCGVPQEKTQGNVDSGSFGWAVLGCCIPIAGLILFLVWKDQKPASAKMAGIGALVCVVLTIVFYAIAGIAGVSAGLLGF